MALRRVKTKAWTRQIINSNIRYPIDVARGKGMIVSTRVVRKIEEAAVVIIPRITCPALILAARRKDKVIGRMYDLRVSTRDRNHAIVKGVFPGRKCADEIFMLLIIDVIIVLVHIGAATLKVIIR